MLAVTARLLLRRWIWVVMIVVVAAAGSVGAFVATKPQYESKASVLVVPSTRQPGVNGATNPYLSLGGSLGIVASVVATRVSDLGQAKQILSGRAGITYSVLPDLDENAGPVLLVTVDGTSSRQTQLTLQTVVMAIATDLRELQAQANAPADQLISSVVLTSSPKPDTVHKQQIQRGIEAGAAILVVLLALLLLIERRRMTRRARIESSLTGDTSSRGRRWEGDSSDAGEPALPALAGSAATGGASGR